MARTIAEIQRDILTAKSKVSALATLEVLTHNEKNDPLLSLTNTSKVAIWRLWVHIMATAIWMHEKIVEKNALVSRPHTLSWYRDQALNFIHGQDLIWEQGSYQFDTTNLDTSQLDAKKIVKYCAVSEVDLSTVIKPDATVTQVFSDYFHHQVGVVFIKVATESGGHIEALDVNHLPAFKEYIARIKDAGNQVHITSTKGDQLVLKLDVYVDPLTVYINPNDIEPYKALIEEGEFQSNSTHLFDTNNGALIANPSIKPVEEAINNYLRNIEFNGAFVQSYLIDAVQKSEGVKIPVLKKVNTAIASISADLPEAFNVVKGIDIVDGNNVLQDIEYFIPKAGYFNLKDALTIEVNYIPYTFYRDNRNA